MVSKFTLSDEEYEILAMGIAFGAGVGILVGCFTLNVELFFVLGAIIGIIISLAYSYYISN